MNTLIICRKELNTYFRSPIAYFVLGIFAILGGYFFYLFVYAFVFQGMRAAMQGQNFPMNLDEMVVRGVLQNLSVIGLFFLPMITMRLFAEEKRSGTIELLVTSPVRDFEIILGKWLGAVVLYAAMLGLILISFLTLFAYGKPDWKAMMVGFLGLLLQGACLLAIGTFISSCTKNQIVAGIASFGVTLLLWVLSYWSDFDASITSKVLNYISVTAHIDSFSKGVLDLKDIIYYVSMTVLGLFLTARSLESIRWRA
jgi:ABC-2 type transport system permease protein